MTASTAQTTAASADEHKCYKEQIRPQLDQILLKNFITTMGVSAVNLTILSGFFLQHVAPFTLACWVFIMILASAGRWRLSVKLLNSNQPISKRQMRPLIVLTLISGAGWGAAPFLLSEGASTALSLSVFMVAGMTAAAAISFGSHLPVVTAFTVPALLGLSFYYITHPGPEEIAMAATLLLYYLAIRQMTKRSNKTLLKALTNEAKAEEQKERIESQKKAFAALAQNYREAADQAKSADMTKSVFIANMSHEIRTPMNGVIGMLTALEQTDLSPDQKRFAEIAQKSANGLLYMINDILDLSKIESGKMTLCQAEFSLSEALDVVVESLRHNASSKGLEIDVDIDEATPQLLIGDETRLRQVLFNIAGNAVKFTDEGKIVIAVKSAGAGKDGRTALTFSISDTGIGISERDLTRLYNRFERADSDRVRETTGAGLGLAIAAELVDLMGGKLKCESEVGEGSTFSFTVVVKAQEDLEHKEHALEGHDDKSPRKYALNLLVAEDNLVNRQVVSALLEKTGIDVTFAVNGQEAVKKVDDQAFDAVLMDVQMPVMNGAEAAVAIRKKGFGPNKLPIFAATADTEFGVSEEFKRAEMNGVIYKPFKFDELLATLETIVDRKLNENAA